MCASLSCPSCGRALSWRDVCNARPSFECPLDKAKLNCGTIVEATMRVLETSACTQAVEKLTHVRQSAYVRALYALRVSATGTQAVVLQIQSLCLSCFVLLAIRVHAHAVTNKSVQRQNMHVQRASDGFRQRFIMRHNRHCTECRIPVPCNRNHGGSPTGCSSC